MIATYPRPHKYENLPTAGKRMARVPRYGRLIGMLPPQRFEKLTNEASLLWEVYTYRTTDADPNAMTGILDDGLKTDGARRLGWYDPSFVPSDGEFRDHQIRRACALLGAIAFEMFAANPRPVLEIEIDYKTFLAKVRKRFKDAGAHVDQDGEPELPAHQKKLGEDLACLFKMNSHGLEHFIFPTDSQDERLRWTDITTMAFFAAYWACRWGTAAEMEMTKEWVVDPLDDVDGDDEIAKATSQTFREFWTFAAEMPDDAIDLARWRRLFHVLYDPTIPEPVVDTEGLPIRSAEFICRSWSRMGGTKEGTEIISKFRGDAAKHAAEILKPKFIRLAFRKLSSDRELPNDTGEFLMGASPDENQFENEKPMHPVVLSPFAMQACCVTNLEYELFDPRHRTARWNGGDHPSVAWAGKVADDSCPVVNVSWYEAACFARWLGRVSLDGTDYRLELPTEAQWEYACRAGRHSPFTFGEFHDGNIAAPDECNFTESYLAEMNEKDATLGWTIPVDAHGPNIWGLYQMHGNVWEWCLDSYAERFYTTQSATEPNPVNTERAPLRVLRGGGWFGLARSCRSAARGRGLPDSRANYVGFRLVAVNASTDTLGPTH